MVELLAFTAEHVCRLTGLSMRQLRYWDKQGFFVPQYVTQERHRYFSRVYSFRDVVGLRTLSLLRNRHQVTLQELRKAGAWLSERYSNPWASLTFYVASRRVFFDDPISRSRIAGRPIGQTVTPIEMQKIASEASRDASELRERHAAQIGKITRNRYVVHNAPVIAGTRVPTSAIWNFYIAGYDTETIVREYPRLTPNDVHAAIEYEHQRRIRQAG